MKTRNLGLKTQVFLYEADMERIEKTYKKGNLIAEDHFFEKFHTLFSTKFDKPGRIDLHIDEDLKINNQGILEIKDEIITVINNYKIYLPLL